MGTSHLSPLTSYLSLLTSHLSLLAISHPLSMAKRSKPSQPHSCSAIAAPSIIQREGCSEGIPSGSSGRMPVSLLTFSIYAFVLFSTAGAHFFTMLLMV